MLLKLSTFGISIGLLLALSRGAFITERNAKSMIQLIGAALLVIVVLIHVAEAYRTLPQMGWGVPTAHDFPLTKDGAKGPTASLSINSFNVLNHPNDATYIGVISSPFFGQAVAAQPARRM